MDARGFQLRDLSMIWSRSLDAQWVTSGYLRSEIQTVQCPSFRPEYPRVLNMKREQIGLRTLLVHPPDTNVRLALLTRSMAGERLHNQSSLAIATPSCISPSQQCA